MKKTVLLSITAIFSIFQKSGGQTGTFRLLEPAGQQAYSFDEIALNEQGKGCALIHEPPCDKCYSFHLLPLYPDAATKSLRVTLPVYYFGAKRYKILYKGDRVVCAYTSDGSGPIFSYDAKSKKAWSRAVSSHVLFGFYSALVTKAFAQGPAQEVLLAACYKDDSFPVRRYPKEQVWLFYLDAAGDTIWTKHYEYGFPGLDTLTVSTVQLERDTAEGSYFYSAKVFTDSAKLRFKQVLVKFDPFGSPLVWKEVRTQTVDQLFVQNDGIYLLGSSAQPLPFSGNKNNAVLAKLGHDLSPKWAVAYSGEKFEYARSTLNFLPDGTMVLGYSTTGAFPTVLARLDKNGQVLGQQGYPFFEPQLDVRPDGSLVLLSRAHFDSSGVFPATIISLTDSLGNIDGCGSFPTCLENAPAGIELGDFALESKSDTVKLNTPAFQLDSVEFAFAPFCDIPPAPAPDFQIPPTACPGDSLRTSGAQNRLATAREWSIFSKNGLETTVRDSFELGFRFREPGVYKVSQKIWFLGCEYEAQKTVTVAEPIGAKIFADSTVCHPPIVLKVATDRPVSQYFWGNGSNSSAVFAETGQKYSVTVTDGLCSASDSFLLESFRPSPDHCFAKIYFPNVFSPDGDGKNDEFFPQGSDFEAIKLTVFDRWGNIWHDGPGAWLPGEQAQPGVFTYVFEYRDLFSNEKKAVSGSVTVAR